MGQLPANIKERRTLGFWCSFVERARRKSIISPVINYLYLERESIKSMERTAVKACGENAETNSPDQTGRGAVC